MWQVGCFKSRLPWSSDSAVRSNSTSCDRPPKTSNGRSNSTFKFKVERSTRGKGGLFYVHQPVSSPAEEGCGTSSVVFRFKWRYCCWCRQSVHPQINVQRSGHTIRHRQTSLRPSFAPPILWAMSITEHYPDIVPRFEHGSHEET